MKKLISSVILSLSLFLPALMAVPVLAQGDWYPISGRSMCGAGTCFGNTFNDGGNLAALVFGSIMLLFFIVLCVALYIYSALALSKLARELKHENPWFAWIPILNVFLFLQLGDQNPLFLFFLLIPGIGELVVPVVSTIAFMKISEKRGYDKMFGLLFLVPVVNLVFLGILAWSKRKSLKIKQ